MTERVGLFGWPLGHSVSAPMHNAAFAALGLDWRYELFPVAPDEFTAEVARLIAVGCRGFNVTIPHKQAAFQLPQVNAITPAAQAIGAVNTLVVNADGSLQADNTDWRGFTRDLVEHNITIQHIDCLVLGTGGSAQAIRYALTQAGARSITQVSRTPRPGVIGYDHLAGLPQDAYLVVNCTPVGMYPNAEQSPWPDGIPFPPRSIIYDLVYNPAQTQLVRQAHEANLPAITGLGMLVWQGAYAFEQWTGQMPPVNVMLAAAKAALPTQTGSIEE